MSFSLSRLAVPLMHELVLRSSRVRRRKHVRCCRNVLLSESFEVCLQLVDGFAHVKMSGFDPDFIFFVNRDGRFLIGALLVDECIPSYREYFSALMQFTRGQNSLVLIVFELKQVVCHRLVCELVHKRCDRVHGAVGNEQRSPWPRASVTLQQQRPDDHESLKHMTINNVDHAAYRIRPRPVRVRLLVLLQRLQHHHRQQLAHMVSPPPLVRSRCPSRSSAPATRRDSRASRPTCSCSRRSCQARARMSMAQETAGTVTQAGGVRTVLWM